MKQNVRKPHNPLPKGRDQEKLSKELLNDNTKETKSYPFLSCCASVGKPNLLYNALVGKK